LNPAHASCVTLERDDATPLQDVARSSRSELLLVPGISDVTASRITAWFGNPDNLSLATELTSLWTSQSGPGRQTDGTKGVLVAGMQLAPADEIVATGAIGVTREQVKRWYVIAPVMHCIGVFCPTHAKRSGVQDHNPSFMTLLTLRLHSQ
jgi:NAD-dependent DNA ligase